MAEIPTKEEKMEYVSIGTLELHEDRNAEEKSEMRRQFAESLEKQRETFAKEKEEIRKHYKNVIKGICVSFVLVMAMIFGIAFYIIYSYDFTSYSQDGDGINNILGESAQQGDLNYEPKIEDNKEQEASVEGHSY